MNPVRHDRMAGRDAELGALIRAADDDAAAGSIVLVIGEAGIGKSRLVQEYLRSARSAGDRVLLGGCVELLGDQLPYAPFAEALRGLQASLAAEPADPLAAETRDSLERLIGLRSGHVDRGRPDLFERILRLLCRVIPDRADASTGRSPRLVIVVEDLHWADQATLDLLIFLGRNLPGDYQIILTCRTEDLPDDRRLQVVLTALRHGRGYLRIELDRLSRQDSAELIAAQTGGTATEDAVARIYERSEGNPLIVEELVESERQGAAMTRSLQDLMLARTARLSDDGRSVVELAAIVGRRVDHDTLAEASELPETALLLGLQDAVAAGVLTVDAEREEYTFRHVLTQQAVLARMLPGRRRLLHLAAARTISGQSATRTSAGRAAEAATHWYASGTRGEAFDASVNAARLSAQVFAYAEAWRHYGHAMRLLDDGPTTNLPSTVDRVRLLAEAAEAARWAGALADALVLVQSARELEPDPRARGRLSERLGRYLWESGRAHDAAAAYSEADDCLQGLAPSATAASVAASRANLLLITGQHSAAVALARDAAALAAAAGAPLAAARADITLGMGMIFLGAPDDGVQLVRRAQPVVAELGDLDERRRAASNLAYALMMVGDTLAACQVALDGVALMRRYGLEAQAGAALTGNALALLSLVGRWDEAERLSDEVLGANIPDAQARHVHLARAKLELARGRLAVARIHLDRAYPPEVLDQTHQLLTAELHSTEAELALEGGHLDDARRWAAKALDNLSPAEHGRIVIQLCRLGLQIEADIAERNLSLKTPDALGEPHREFLAGTLAAATASAGPDVRAHQATAAAEYRRSLLTSDPKAWAAAAAAWEALHRSPTRRTASCAGPRRNSTSLARGGPRPGRSDGHTGLHWNWVPTRCCAGRSTSRAAAGSRSRRPHPIRARNPPPAPDTPPRPATGWASPVGNSTCCANSPTAAATGKSPISCSSALARWLCMSLIC